MATKLTVKRADLIAAIEKKAKANKKSYDELQKKLASEPASLTSTIHAAILADFEGIPKNNYNTHGSGYVMSTVISYANTLLTSLGMKTIPASTANNFVPLSGPRLFEAELAILNMSTDETLVLDDSSDYFAFLKAA